MYLREGVTMMDNHDILQCWTYINTLGHYYVIVACYNVKHTKWREGIMLHRYYSGVVARRHYVTYATMLNVHNYARALLRNRGMLQC